MAFKYCTPQRPPSLLTMHQDLVVLLLGGDAQLALQFWKHRAVAEVMPANPIGVGAEYSTDERRA